MPYGFRAVSVAPAPLLSPRQGRSRDRATAKPSAKVPKSQFALLKEKASKKKVERIPGRHLLVAEDVYLVRELVVRMLKGILMQV